MEFAKKVKVCTFFFERPGMEALSDQIPEMPVAARNRFRCHQRWGWRRRGAGDVEQLKQRRNGKGESEGAGDR